MIVSDSVIAAPIFSGVAVDVCVIWLQTNHIVNNNRMAHTKPMFATCILLFIACSMAGCRHSESTPETSVTDAAQSTLHETEEPNSALPTIEWSSTPAEIVGTDRFEKQVEDAMELLRHHSPDTHRLIQTYVGVIQQGEKSGMCTPMGPPKFEMADPTTFHSITWCAGSIAHDAFHSKQS